MSSATVIHKNPISSLSRLFSVGVSNRTEFSSAFWGRLSVGTGTLALVRARLEKRQSSFQYNKLFVASRNLFFRLCAQNPSSDESGRPKQHRRAHDNSINGERHESMFLNPRQKPRNGTVGDYKGHCESDCQHDPLMWRNLRNSDRVFAFPQHRFVQG